MSTITFGSSRESTNPIQFSLSFPEAQPVLPVGVGKKPHPTNFIYGGFHLTNVPSWEEIWYPGLYPGIDLRYYMTAHGLKYDFLVHPGADPAQITLTISDSMVLSIRDQTVSFHPVKQPEIASFQETGLRVEQADGPEIPAHFITKGTTGQSYGFQLGLYDRNQILIIDPVWLPFSTFLGGNGDDPAIGITVDAAGNCYVTGQTTSNDFPTVNAYKNTCGGLSDVFVTKLNPTGTGLEFSTFLGGSGDEKGRAIAVDATGSCYITGFTSSSDFPVVSAYQDTYGGGDTDAFVTKLNPTGTGLEFSTFLGGSSFEWGRGIAVDGVGQSYVTGFTYSSDFPVVNAYQDTYGGGIDVFVAKLMGNMLLYSTFLGGSGNEHGRGIAVDAKWNIYVTGYTSSSDFPVVSAYQDTYGGGIDVFVTKLTGTGLEFSTFLGGSDSEEGRGIAVDGFGNIYVTGVTFSSDFPVVSAYQDTFGGGDRDAFVAKLNAAGTGLEFSTFLGGSGDEYANDIAVDVAGNCYITGSAFSRDFPMVNAHQDTYGGGDRDAFVTKLNPTGTGLEFSTFLGGSGGDYGNGIAVDAVGNCYITGSTYSRDFPVVNAYQDTHGGGDFDAFVTKLSVDTIAPSISLTSPINGSIALSSTLINLKIMDDASGVSQVLYNWDGTANATLDAPHDVPLPVDNGPHVLQVYATDLAGNWDDATFLFTTDDTRPIITLSSPTNNSVHQSGVSIELSVMDVYSPIGQVLINWDDRITNATLPSPYETTLLAGDGPHVLRVFVTDLAGNWATLKFVFTTDDTPPTAAFSGISEFITVKEIHTITVMPEDVTGIERVEFLLDGTPVYSASSPPYIWTWDTTSVSDGDHIVTIRVFDIAGNIYDQTFTVKVSNVVSANDKYWGFTLQQWAAIATILGVILASIIRIIRKQA